MTRFADTRPSRRTVRNTDVDRLARTRYLGTQLTPSPEDLPPSGSYDLPAGVGFNTKARCWTCWALSEPRPMGETPTGWGRDLDGEGRYFCPSCVVERAA